jgi:hypothetical protein
MHYSTSSKYVCMHVWGPLLPWLAMLDEIGACTATLLWPRLPGT